MDSRKRSKRCWPRRILLLPITAGLAASCLIAQNNNVLTAGPVPRISVKRGEEFTVKLPVAVRPGYHVNSNAPEEDYLIPLRVTWTGAAAKPEQTVYPHAKHERFAFSMKPLAIFSGAFDVVTKFKADANAPVGASTMTGKVRYQACNDRECLPPRTVEVQLPLNIR